MIVASAVPDIGSNIICATRLRRHGQDIITTADPRVTGKEKDSDQPGKRPVSGCLLQSTLSSGRRQGC